MTNTPIEPHPLHSLFEAITRIEAALRENQIKKVHNISDLSRRVVSTGTE
jgi:hypothetical protein